MRGIEGTCLRPHQTETDNGDLPSPEVSEDHGAQVLLPGMALHPSHAEAAKPTCGLLFSKDVHEHQAWRRQIKH